MTDLLFFKKDTLKVCSCFALYYNANIFSAVTSLVRNQIFGWYGVYISLFPPRKKRKVQLVYPPAI